MSIFAVPLTGTTRVVLIDLTPYPRSILSYPRTDTDVFAPSMDLAGLVQLQTMHPVWGNFAQTLVRFERDGALLQPCESPSFPPAEESPHVIRTLSTQPAATPQPAKRQQ